jgi:hypothetical protein
MILRGIAAGSVLWCLRLTPLFAWVNAFFLAQLVILFRESGLLWCLDHANRRRLSRKDEYLFIRLGHISSYISRPVLAVLHWPSNIGLDQRCSHE